MGYIKSPMNYTGGKYKLLNQILPLFPNEINTFIDLFCGGCNVGINVNANKIICNDICEEVINVYKGIQKNGVENSLLLVKDTINYFNLSKTNEEGFYNIRKYYNDGNKEWYVFYAMLTNAFNYQIRFNKKGEYNMPFGKNRSSFNNNLEKNFIKFSQEISSKNIFFTNFSFDKLNVNKLNENDFVYIDPPYLISTASYNEQDGWNKDKELLLYQLCDDLNAKGIKFAMSNVLKHKGKENIMLMDWSKKYNINYLNYNYNNCNYHKKNKECESVEVLIMNY